MVFFTPQLQSLLLRLQVRHGLYVSYCTHSFPFLMELSYITTVYQFDRKIGLRLQSMFSQSAQRSSLEHRAWSPSQHNVPHWNTEHVIPVSTTLLFGPKSMLSQSAQRSLLAQRACYPSQHNVPY